MAEDRRKDELEHGDGKPLPQREMMSLISTDPADPMYSSLVPAGAPVEGGPVTTEAPPLGTLPVTGDGAGDADLDSEPRSETISQHDEASAG